MKKLPYLLISLPLLFSISACTTPLVIVGAIAGVGTAVAVTDRRSTSKLVEDQSVETQVTDFIYGHEEIGKKVRVKVTSFNGTVLLTGEVPDEESKNIILEKANSLRYVERVIDAMEFKPKLSVLDANNDSWLTTKTKSSLMLNKSIITNTKVVTSNRKIYLMGLVDNNEAKTILEIANKIEGATAVIPLFESKKGKLESNLTAASFKSEEKKIEQKKSLEDRLEAEDIIEVKPYVLPTPIIISNDE